MLSTCYVLSLGMLHSYKAGRAVQSAPKELTSHHGGRPGGGSSAPRSAKQPHPAATHQQATAQVRRPSTNRSNSRPAVIREESYDLANLRLPLPYTASTFSVSGGGRDFGEGGLTDPRLAEPLVIREKLGKSEGGRSAGRYEQLELTSGRPTERAERQMDRSERLGARLDKHVERVERFERPAERSERLLDKAERPIERSERPGERADIKQDTDKFLHKLRNEVVARQKLSVTVPVLDLLNQF